MNIHKASRKKLKKLPRASKYFLAANFNDNQQINLM